MEPSAKRFRHLLRAASLYIGLALLFAVDLWISPPGQRLDNQRDVLWQVSNNGVVAVGMTLVILTGGIDLSVGSLLSVCSVVCAMLLMDRTWTEATSLTQAAAVVAYGGLAGWLVFKLMGPMAKPREPGPVGVAGLPSGPRSAKLATVVATAVVAALVGLWIARQAPHGFGTVGVLLLIPAVGTLLGAANGILIAKGRMQPFIVTLAMMISAVGLAKLIAGGGGRIHPVYFGDVAREAVAPRNFEWLASNLSVFKQELIPVPGIFFAATAVLAWLLLNKLPVGRHIYAVGGNEETARLAGINVDRVKTLVYSISGFVCAVAAVLYCAQFQQGKADAGSGRELDAIAAVVIGGTSLMGGRGGIGGTIIGVFMFGYLSNILNLRGVKPEWQLILKGVIIVLAVLLQEGILARWLADTWHRLRTQRT